MNKAKNKNFLGIGLLMIPALLLVLVALVVWANPVSASTQLYSTGENAIALQAQATPGAATPLPAATPLATPRTNPNPSSQPGSVPTAPTTTATDNSWILWLVLIIVILAALGGGFYYYPRRTGVVRRTETEYTEDRGPTPEF